MIIIYIHVAQPFCAEAHLLQLHQGQEYRAWTRYWALTLVKQSGLWGSNMPWHGTDYLVWVPLLLNLSHLIWVFVKVSVFSLFVS